VRVFKMYSDASWAIALSLLASGCTAASVPSLAARAAAVLRAGHVHVEPQFLRGQQLDQARQAAAMVCVCVCVCWPSVSPP
jgi:hypothetical protein